VTLPGDRQAVEHRRVDVDAELLQGQGVVEVDADVVGGPTDRLARAVLVTEPRAIMMAVSRSTLASIAISSMNLPYLLSPIWRKGRSLEARRSLPSG
jgi:hypothetical protein